MIRALFKKQIMESFSWIYMDRKTGKNRTKASLLIYGLLYIWIFGVLGVVFYLLAQSLCAPLVQAGIGWLYFAVMGLVAVVIGVFGSVFNTYSALYQARDNNLLLSLPISAGKLLVMRLSGVYMMGLLYEVLAIIPALILWFSCQRLPSVGVLFSLLIPLVLSVFILTLSCVVGWGVAKISSRVKSKAFVTVALSLGFIAVYYYGYFHAYSYLMSFLENADAIAASGMKHWNPLYHLGIAAEGNVGSMLFFTGIITLFFAVVYLVLRNSFLKIATSNRGAAKVQYQEKTVKVGNADSALLRKEFRRFTGSATYMMNCGLGCVFLVIAAMAILLKQDLLKEMLYAMFAPEDSRIPLMAAAAVCLMTTMNDMTAPSISLEGKNLWLIQALPVSGWQVLKAKLKLQLILTLIPTALLVVCVEYVFRFGVVYNILIPVLAALFILFMAESGLVVNLKMPNLNWTSEVAPVKQSAGVVMVLLGGWGIVAALGALYFAVADFVMPLLYMITVCVVLSAASVYMFLWLKNRGAGIFSRL